MRTIVQTLRPRDGRVVIDLLEGGAVDVWWHQNQDAPDEYDCILDAVRAAADHKTGTERRIQELRDELRSEEFNLQRQQKVIDLLTPRIEVPA